MLERTAPRTPGLQAHPVRSRRPSIASCPLCGDDLRAGVVRCEGCGVVVGIEGTARRFAPASDPARAGRSPASPSRTAARASIWSLPLALLGTLGVAVGTFLIVRHDALLGASACSAATALVVLGVAGDHLARVARPRHQRAAARRQS